MQGAGVRQKGQRGEHAVAALLQEAVAEVWEYHCPGQEPPVVSRNLVQTREGGHDLVGVEWCAVEVKWQETNFQKAWWQQTVEQAADLSARTGKHIDPVLFYKRNHQPWRVVTIVQLQVPHPTERNVFSYCATLELPSFMDYFKRRTYAELQELA